MEKLWRAHKDYGAPRPDRRVKVAPSVASHAIGFAEPRPDVGNPGIGVPALRDDIDRGLQYLRTPLVRSL